MQFDDVFVVVAKSQFLVVMTYIVQITLHLKIPLY